MSYHTWHNYGYGICVDDIQAQSVQRLQALLKLAPKLDGRIHAWLSDLSVTEPDWDDYMGLATILQQVIEEADGLCLTACDDSSGRTYLIYQPRYPWEITEKELDLTEDKLNELFSRYVSILTDDPIEIDAQEVENGG